MKSVDSLCDIIVILTFLYATGDEGCYRDVLTYLTFRANGIEIDFHNPDSDWGIIPDR